MYRLCLGFGHALTDVLLHLRALQDATDQAFLLRKELHLIDSVVQSQAKGFLSELHVIYQREDVLTTDLETQTRYLTHRRGDALAWHERFMALFAAMEEGFSQLSEWPSTAASSARDDSLAPDGAASRFALSEDASDFLQRAGQAALVQQLDQVAQAVWGSDGARRRAFDSCAAYLRQYTFIASGYPTEVRESSRLSVWTKLFDDVLEDMSPKACQVALAEAFRAPTDDDTYRRVRAREEQLVAALEAAERVVSDLAAADEDGGDIQGPLLESRAHSLQNDLRLLAQTASSVANDPQIFEPFECAMLPILDELCLKLRTYEALLSESSAVRFLGDRMQLYVDACSQFEAIVHLLRLAYTYHGTS